MALPANGSSARLSARAAGGAGQHPGIPPAEACPRAEPVGSLTGANLYEAILNYAILVETNLRQANLTGCSVCGLTAWNIHLEGANQADLVITFPSSYNS